MLETLGRHAKPTGFIDTDDLNHFIQNTVAKAFTKNPLDIEKQKSICDHISSAVKDVITFEIGQHS
jgi:hypothetical protein